jgi:hypothetical protein
MLKDKSEGNIARLNEVLKELGIESIFLAESDNQAWLDDINKNPESPQKHLKPQDREMTLQELKDMFRGWTIVGQYQTDLYYGRTSDEQMEKLGKFIFDYASELEEVGGVKLLIERGNIPEEYHKTLLTLKKEEVPPKMLPEDKQYKPDLESGNLLCKSYSPNPFWVLYGKVDKPKFLKEKIYEEEVYNNLYRDSKGLGYLLIPLYDFSQGFGERVFQEAWDMGLREHPNYFLPMVYNFDVRKEDIKEIGDTFAVYYTPTELVERFQRAIATLVLPLHSGLDADGKGFIKIYGQEFRKDNSVWSKVFLINALKHALVKHYGRCYVIAQKLIFNNKVTVDFKV